MCLPSSFRFVTAMRRRHIPDTQSEIHIFEQHVLHQEELFHVQEVDYEYVYDISTTFDDLTQLYMQTGVWEGFFLVKMQWQPS